MTTGRAILIITLLGLTAAIWLHANEVRKKNKGLDKLERSLSGLRKFISPGSNIRVENYTEVADLQYWTRYILAPANTNHQGKDDTLLSLHTKDATDTRLNGRAIVWRHSDENYLYILSTKP
jgi:hypothetical protein